MRACAAASEESKRSCAINGAAPAIAIAAKMVQSLLVIALSPPSATMPSTATRPSTTAESASAESTPAERAPGSHARESVVALHARHTAVVITSEGTVIARPAALLKTRISETLLRRHLAATKALAPCAAESAGLAAADTAITGGPKPSGHCAIGIRNAESVFRIMIPH